MSDKFLRYYKYLIIEVLFLIALGGAVRTMDAGLACPDWPPASLFRVYSSGDGRPCYDWYDYLQLQNI
jgi:heme A synthase